MKVDLTGYAVSGLHIVNRMLAPSSPLYDELVDGGRLGGFLCVGDLELGLPHLIVRLGNPIPEKAAKSLGFCQEKNLRLAKHPEHMLSAESRNPELNEWGGAVRGTETLTAFSGFPEDLDSVVAVLTQYEQGEYTDTRGKHFGMAMDRLGDNPYIKKLGHRDILGFTDR